MKSVFLAFLWRMPTDRRQQHERKFADSIIPLIYPEVRARLEDHRKSGHLLILASASPEGYVKEIGKRLGFDISLGTPVQYGPLFPPLNNHKGAAKVERLRAFLSENCFANGKLIHGHGYTDSMADLPMLAICDTATVVNPKRKLEAIARENGWKIMRPTRPWRSPLDHAARSLCLLLGIGRDPAGCQPQA